MTDARIAFMLLWAKRNGFFRAVPHRGERPSPHQETEAAAPAGNATRSHSNTTQEVPAEILPSDASGKSRIKPSSDGWGGEVNTVSCVSRCVPSDIVKEPCAGNPSYVAPSRGCPVWCRPLLKNTLMKTNFNVNLNFSHFLSLLKTIRLRIVHDRYRTMPGMSHGPAPCRMGLPTGPIRARHCLEHPGQTETSPCRTSANASSSGMTDHHGDSPPLSRHAFSRITDMPRMSRIRHTDCTTHVCPAISPSPAPCKKHTLSQRTRF